MTDILKRLKEATGTGRELDAMIAVSLQIMPSNAFQPCASPDAGTFGTGAHTFWRAPEYTASIDAAIALVERMLPDHRAAIYTNGGGNGPCCLILKASEPVIANIHAPTIPLAILTALFTALEAKAHD